MEAGSGLQILTVPVLRLLVYLIQHVAVGSGSGKNDLEKMSNIPGSCAAELSLFAWMWPMGTQNILWSS